MAFQSPRSAQLGRSSSLTLSVASPTPSMRQPVGTPRRLSGAVLPADRSAASRRELNDILAQLDTPRTEGGHGGGYDSPRGRQPVTAGGSLNGSKRPGIAAQFPVQTTSPMSVLNAGSSKTVSQVMQAHSYASPRAGQAGRSSSTSFSSPRSSSRGLVGTHRSVTPPPSQGELEDIGNDLKRMLATPVESPRREPLNIQPPPERADLQLVFTVPAPEPEPEPECEREPLQLLDSEIVVEAERQYAERFGLVQQAHLAKLRLATDKKEPAAPVLKSPYQQQQQPQQQPQPQPQREESSQQKQMQQETQQQPRLLTLGQQQEVSLFMEQQRDAERWRPWQLQHTSQQPDQQDKRAREQYEQLRLSVTGSLGEGQKFGLATSINRELEQQRQQRQQTSLGAHEAGPTATTQQSWPYGQKLRAPAKTMSLEDFRRDRQAEDRQARTTAGVSKRSDLADILAEQRQKLEERSGTAIQDLGPAPVRPSYGAIRARAARPSVLDDEEALSYLKSNSRRDN